MQAKPNSIDRSTIQFLLLFGIALVVGATVIFAMLVCTNYNNLNLLLPNTEDTSACGTHVDGPDAGKQWCSDVRLNPVSQEYFLAHPGNVYVFAAKIGGPTSFYTGGIVNNRYPPHISFAKNEIISLQYFEVVTLKTSNSPTITPEVIADKLVGEWCKTHEIIDKVSCIR